MTWQTIESAPTDGTVVDVWDEGKRVVGAWFHEGRWLTYRDEWTSELHPTHWMPQPDPPEGETDGRDNERMRALGNLGALWQI